MAGTERVAASCAVTRRAVLTGLPQGYSHVRLAHVSAAYACGARYLRRLRGEASGLHPSRCYYLLSQSNCCKMSATRDMER